MKPFPDENFLLHNHTARKLFHEIAKDLPIIDYHNHLPEKQIAADLQFENLTQAWLYGDHYKWRAMRANGVEEKYCTGNAPDFDKFSKWAETIPYTLRNPLYHWSHLELQRYFSIHDLVQPGTAKSIYERCSAMLSSREYSVRNLLRKMKVTVLCTTNDPLDRLESHQKIKADGFEIKVFAAFRPDHAVRSSDAVLFNRYLERLEAGTGMSITRFDDYVGALKICHDYFASQGCTVSDHGVERFYDGGFTQKEITGLFERLRSGNNISREDHWKFQTALYRIFAEWNYEKNWVQQFHIGAIRNNNSRMTAIAGDDAGCDSIGDFPQAAGLAGFLDSLESGQKLTRTILYNLNPADNEMMATMAGNFNDGSTAGKIQWGAAWWFLDQKDGITKQLNTLSNMGLLSRFAGMLTDSRSFLSFPRHEYFRRVLCNLLGEEMENGEIPDDLDWTSKLLEDICYRNTLNYFGW